MKKEWLKPELMNLGAERTNEGETKDFPHFWACNACGKHYTTIFEPTGACKRCGSTDGYTVTGENGDAVTLPDFSDNLPSPVIS